MATSDKVTIFTGKMRAEFLNSMDQLRPVTIGALDKVITKIDSTSRIEEYPWMSPPPRLKRWKGFRNYTRPASSKYRVENFEYDAAQAFKLRDIEDDQTGGYKLQMQAMAKDQLTFWTREATKLLRDNGGCFDGSQFFADSHNIGTGDNNLTKDCASNDGATHTVIAMLTTGTIKPIIWQDRKNKGLEDNSGTKEMKESKELRMWLDCEGAVAFGYWWDAVKVTVTDTPTVLETTEIIRDVEKAFRNFKLDKADPTDDDDLLHEQMVFNKDSLVYLVNPALENLFRTALMQATIQGTGGAIDNIYNGHGDLQVSGYLGN